jgi:hypothetical protein
MKRDRPSGPASLLGYAERTLGLQNYGAVKLTTSGSDEQADSATLA